MKATHIVVAQAGWVFVGTRELTDKQCTLKNASCIRRWGTTEGLGQLALSGPQKETVLEPCGVIEFPLHALLFSIPVVATKWL